jgi:hypothetical protein
MSELFGKFVDLSSQASITNGCDLEDDAGCVGECYDSDCCHCEQYSDD